MPPTSRDSELDAARIVEHVTGRVLTPYDRCVECGEFHDTSAPVNGRYDFHQGQDGALEVTLATSSVAERNERQWNPYITPRPAPSLRFRWHVIVDSTAKVRAPRGRKRDRAAKGFFEAVSPALAELEQRRVSHWAMWSTCSGAPFHEPACPYGVLDRAGVTSVWSAEPAGEGTGEISIAVLFGYDAMPAFDEEGEQRRRAAQRRKELAKGDTWSVPHADIRDGRRLGPVQWSFDPGFISRLEEQRADGERLEAECIRAVARGRLSEPEIAECARKEVDARIAMARAMTWQEVLPPPPGARRADTGMDLVDLLEFEFSLHTDLEEKLLRDDPPRAMREVFFWLTWTRAPAWYRLARHSPVPQRAPELPDGVTGVWVGCQTDGTQVLHWDAETGWNRHGLEVPLLASVCRG